VSADPLSPAFSEHHFLQSMSARDPKATAKSRADARDLDSGAIRKLPFAPIVAGASMVDAGSFVTPPTVRPAARSRDVYVDRSGHSQAKRFKPDCIAAGKATPSLFSTVSSAAALGSSSDRSSLRAYERVLNAMERQLTERTANGISCG
jgi:hypothetical protein